MEIYVNLHPNYDYANVMVGGFIEELKEYVNLVAWLSWDYASSKGRPFIRVSGKNHLERVYVLLQRLMDEDVEIYIRNERADEWEKYKAEKVYTSEEMVAMERQRDKEPDEWKWAKEDLEKANKYISMSLEKGIEPDDMILTMKKEAEERNQKNENAERDRIYKILKIWN